MLKVTGCRVAALLSDAAVFRLLDQAMTPKLAGYCLGLNGTILLLQNKFMDGLKQRQRDAARRR